MATEAWFRPWYKSEGARSRRRAPLSRHPVRSGRLHVLVDELGHLEHRDFALAAEDDFELVVRVDHAALLLILQPVPLDVLPQLLRHFGSRHRTRANHRTERGVGLHGLHEGRIWRSLRAAALRAAPLRCLASASACFPVALFRASLSPFRSLSGCHSLSR